MTDADAPERIWAGRWPHGGRAWRDAPAVHIKTAYIRADLVEAMEAEVTYPDFIYSVLCDVQDYDTSLYDYARAVSTEIRRAFRAALHNTEANHDD